MYIKVTAPFTIDEDWMKQPLHLGGGEYASVADDVGRAAIQQGAAVETTLEAIRAAAPSYVPHEDVEALASFAAGDGPKTEPLSMFPPPAIEAGAWTPPADVAEVVAKHKGKGSKKFN